MASGVTAALGFALLDGAAPAVLAAITAVAAGAILADAMIPEAFEEDGQWAGLLTCLGFLTAFAVSRA